MTKQELVRAISMETGIDQTTALTAVEAFMEITKKTMADGENIYLRGFGTFNLKKRATSVRKKPSSFPSTSSPHSSHAPSFSIR